MCFHPALFEGICMKIIFILLFIFILFFPATAFSFGNRESNYPVISEVIVNNNNSQPSMREQYTSGYWIARSSNNKLIVIGVSNPMLRRDSEIAAAKEDAARKVAMFYGIHGSVETTSRTGTDFFDYMYYSNIEIIYDTNYESYIEQLTFDPQNDVLIIGEAVFVRFQHDTTVTDIEYTIMFAGGRPDWTRNKPEFDGYVTTVGFAQNQRRLKDTIFRSTENAVVRMIENLSTTVNTRETITGQGSSSFIQTKSEGRLSNFRVIDFWIEPETRFVYTLAIAGSGE
jgi:hypothetical protein